MLFTLSNLRNHRSTIDILLDKVTRALQLYNICATQLDLEAYHQLYVEIVQWMKIFVESKINIIDLAGHTSHILRAITGILSFDDDQLYRGILRNARSLAPNDENMKQCAVRHHTLQWNATLLAETCLFRHLYAAPDAFEQHQLRHNQLNDQTLRLMALCVNLRADLWERGVEEDANIFKAYCKLVDVLPSSVSEEVLAGEGSREFTFGVTRLKSACSDAHGPARLG
jgi:hypothetical protein